MALPPVRRPASVSTSPHNEVARHFILNIFVQIIPINHRSAVVVRVRMNANHYCPVEVHYLQANPFRVAGLFTLAHRPAMLKTPSTVTGEESVSLEKGIALVI